MRGLCLVGLVSVTACIHELPAPDLRDLAGDEVTLDTRTHGRVEAFAVAEQDGAVMFTTHERTLVRLDEVDAITRRRPSRGALEGAGLGLLGGAALGAVIGYSQSNQCVNPENGCDEGGYGGLNHGGRAIVLGTAGALIGALAGAVIGRFRGRDVYSRRHDTR
jgi:hypothetical protein